MVDSLGSGCESSEESDSPIRATPSFDISVQTSPGNSPTNRRLINIIYLSIATFAVRSSTSGVKSPLPRFSPEHSRGRHLRSRQGQLHTQRHSSNNPPRCKSRVKEPHPYLPFLLMRKNSPFAYQTLNVPSVGFALVRHTASVRFGVGFEFDETRRGCNDRFCVTSWG